MTKNIRFDNRIGEQLKSKLVVKLFGTWTTKLMRNAAGHVAEMAKGGYFYLL